MPHNFKQFPELTNQQMELYYFQSPHQQITEDFRAKCVKVIDGDTIKLEVNFRDFYFPLRFANIAAAEMNEGGEESKSWLEKKVLGKKVDIILSPNRVEKWGRLLGNVILEGLDVGEESMAAAKSTPWKQRGEGQIPDFDKEMKRAW